MRILLFAFMGVSASAFAQSVIVQKCPASALEEVSYVTVSQDTASQIQTVVSFPEQESSTIPKPLENSGTTISIQPVHTRPED